MRPRTQPLPFSTGVIMEPLPLDRIEAGLPAALADLAPERWADAAEAIMTTDTLPKAASRRLVLGGRAVTVTGIAKGAGMIRPNMATMLGFVATDAAVEHGALQALAQEAARRAEQERREAARLAEREQTAAELRQREVQEQARRYREELIRQGRVWGAVEEVGRKARAADRARQGPEREREGEREGPSMGR